MSEKEELKNITNELKELSKFFDIPTITAQQLNRTGASVVDAALQAKKEDVTRLVGRDAIAGAWEIIENSDFVCIINPEVKVDTGELFLTFKMLKRRYRSSEEDEKLRRLEYFNHPFEYGNEIKLIDDIDFDKCSLSLSDSEILMLPFLCFLSNFSRSSLNSNSSSFLSSVLGLTSLFSGVSSFLVSN